MKQLFNFNQEEACNNFITAALYDKKCAFAYWGICYSLQLNINHVIISPIILKFALSAYKKADYYKSNSPEIVKDMINALWYRISTNNNPSYQEIEKAMLIYSNKMKYLYNKYSNPIPNLNIAVLYALSIMTIKPWKWWPQGSIYNSKKMTLNIPNDIENVLYILLNVINISPGHIGALHLIIHAIEESPFPYLGLAAAYSLKNSVFNLGHLVHMPSHIFSRLGMYKDSIQCNINAINADNKFMLNKTLQNKNKILDSYYIVEYYSHNNHFIIVDAERMGNLKLCLKYLINLENHVNLYINIKKSKNLFLEHFLSVRCQVLLRFGKYNDILRLKEPNHFFKNWLTIYYYCCFVSCCKLNKKDNAFRYYKLFNEVVKIFINEIPKKHVGVVVINGMVVYQILILE